MRHNNLRPFLTILVALLATVLSFAVPRTALSQGQADGSVNIIIFRDKDSLTIYVPGTGPTSLRGLQFEITDNQGKRYGYLLEQYASFVGLNFDAIPTPICLRLVRQGVNTSFPTECLNLQPNQRLSHAVIDADVFWYDQATGQGYLLTITRSTMPANICPPQDARCPVIVPPAPTPSGAPNPTPTLIGMSAPASNLLGGGSGKIAFLSNRDGGWDIYLVNVDGSNIQRLTKEGSYKEQLSWSPDGKHIAFNANREENWEIYVLDIDTGDQRNLTNNPAVDYHPAWSPDGSRIAFSSNRDGKQQIYTMNPDGSNVVRLTNSSADDIQPAWSTDGKYIAFVSFRDQGKERVYVMNADGSNQHNVSKGTDNFAPAWAPDGKQIAFTAGTDKLAAVWLINIDGSRLHNLTYNPGFSGFPSWSPDGKYVAFANAHDGIANIYIIGSDALGQHKLTDGSSIDAYPVWQP